MVKKGAGSSTPNSKTMAQLRLLGYTPWLVQNRVTPMVSVDLYNIIDVIGYGHGGIIMVQATSRGCRTDHLVKMRENEHLFNLLSCGIMVEIWCYWQRKSSNRVWLSRERFKPDLSLDVVYYGLASEVDGGEKETQTIHARTS